MTEKDMARIDGKEYDIRKDCTGDCRLYDCDCESNGAILADGLCLIPHLKQTGWICKHCVSRSVNGCLVTHNDKPSDCPVSKKIDNNCGWPKWEPFYGKVFQE